MRLDEYLEEKRMPQRAFAALLNPPVTQSLVSQWIQGSARVMLDQALQIEALTNGRVTPRDLAELYRGKKAAEATT